MTATALPKNPAPIRRAALAAARQALATYQDQADAGHPHTAQAQITAPHQIELACGAVIQDLIASIPDEQREWEQIGTATGMSADAAHETYYGILPGDLPPYDEE